jgi:hypothetical protein
MTFSKELLFKCFPHRESILYNLNIAIELSVARDTFEDTDRIGFLCDCHLALQEGDIKKAQELAALAGYNLMAQGIGELWG